MPAQKRRLQIIGLFLIVPAAVLGWINIALRLADRGLWWYYPAEVVLLVAFALVQLRIIRLSKSTQ